MGGECGSAGVSVGESRRPTSEFEQLLSLRSEPPLTCAPRDDRNFDEDAELAANEHKHERKCG